MLDVLNQWIKREITGPSINNYFYQTTIFSILIFLYQELIPRILPSIAAVIMFKIIILCMPQEFTNLTKQNMFGEPTQ